MKLDLIDSIAVAVVGVQGRGVRVRLLRPSSSLRGPRSKAERRNSGGVTAKGCERLRQHRVAVEYVALRYRRWLVEHGVGGGRGRWRGFRSGTV